MRVIGLTGGMGMGKSTAADIFRRARIPVFDADRAVHALEARGGRAVKPIAAAFPDVVREGAVDRGRLRACVAADPAAMARLEAILHPLVRDAERAFLARARRAGRRLAVLDIPLLFETGGERRVDEVVVVSAPAAVQQRRLSRRGKMQPGELSAILSRQMPDREKRQRADHVVPTGLSRHHGQRVLRRLIGRLLG
ncbi:MAG TPA: dephospho-CoA kinase [Acetobacteraceae bacterium]|jgi:dephospho-CoA kinase|nr:dephospho-CoA kinase [Acetobacteraceae bacterium]